MAGLHLGLLAAIAVRTAIVLLSLVIGLRVLGKRYTGEFDSHDLLLVFLMSNAVQNAMTKGNGYLLVGLTSAAVLLLMGWLAAGMNVRWPSLQTRLMGAPTILVQDGRIIQRNLKRESLGEDEVMLEVRKQGLADLHDVKLALLEIDGSISVIPRQPPQSG